jgi:hypothetical protein
MGPWSHGDWARNSAKQVIGNINFGDSISGFIKNIEAKFFVISEKIMEKVKINSRRLMFLIRVKKNGKRMMLGLQRIQKRKFFHARERSQKKFL